MKKLLTAILFSASAPVAFAAPGNAATLLSDGFEADAAGTPQNTLTNFTVSSPTIDIVNTGTFSIDCNGGTKCLDLDGTPGLGGILTKGSWAFSAGDVFTLSFFASGNQRGPSQFADAFSAGFLLNGLTEINFNSPIIDPGAPFAQYSYSYTATGSGMLQAYIRANAAGSDNIGVVIDDINLSAVPEPATWLMMIMGFGLIGAGLRRSKKTELRVRYS